MRLFEHADFEQAIIQAAGNIFPVATFARTACAFARSDALFLPADLAASIGAEYDAQCRTLCYGPYPEWREVQARLMEIRDLL
jgi:hypothetical protein